METRTTLKIADGWTGAQNILKVVVDRETDQRTDQQTDQWTKRLKMTNNTGQSTAQSTGQSYDMVALITEE